MTAKDYSKELTPEQREEWAKIEAAVAQVKENQRIADAQKTFEKIKVGPRITVDSGNGNAKKGQQQQEQKKQQQEGEIIFSVPEACRLNSGYAKVRGIISTVTPLRKMVKATTFTCMNCSTLHSYEYTDSDKDPRPEFQPNRKEYGTSRCINCGEKYFRIQDSLINAVVIELKDAETYSEIDLLHAILFEDDTRISSQVK